MSVHFETGLGAAAAAAAASPSAAAAFASAALSAAAAAAHLPPPSPASRSAGYWVAGVSVAVLAQFASNLGSILQKRSHNDEALRPAAAQRAYGRRPLWWAGMGLILAGSAADFVALTLAPQSIVATLGCLTLVAQVLWAPLLLGERLSARHYVATGLILVGVVLAVAWGPRGAEGHLALAALLARFASAAFAGYAAAVVAAVAALWAAVAWVERRFAPLPAKPALADYVAKPAAAAGGPAAAACSPACDGRLARFHRVAYGMLSGLAGAQVVLLGKFVGEAAAITLGGDPGVIVSPTLYAVLLGLVVVIAGQIYFMNEGVARFQSLYVLPVFQAVWTLTSVLGGLVVYGEWADLGRSAARKVIFPLGIFMTLFAVYYLMNTPALPESTKRNACLDRCFGTERPPPEHDGLLPPLPPPPHSAEPPLLPLHHASGGEYSGGAQRAGDDIPHKSPPPPLPPHADGSSAAAAAAAAVRKRGGAASGASGAAGGEQAALLHEEDGPIDWDRTCTEIWALEVAEAAPQSSSLDALAAAARADGRAPPMPTPPLPAAGDRAPHGGHAATARGEPPSAEPAYWPESDALWAQPAVATDPAPHVWSAPVRQQQSPR